MPRQKGKFDKRIDLTEEQIKQVGKYAAVGLTLDQIAALCDVSPKTMDEIIKRQPGVGHAIEKGRATGVGGVANTLYQQAMSGNLTAAIFYLKTRARWAEAKPVEVDDDGNETQITLNYQKAKKSK